MEKRVKKIPVASVGNLGEGHIYVLVERETENYNNIVII